METDLSDNIRLIPIRRGFPALGNHSLRSKIDKILRRIIANNLLNLCTIAVEIERVKTE